MTYEDILNASVGLATVPITRRDKNKGFVTKDYVTVTERVKAFRKLLPEGSIVTEILSDDGDKVVMRASVYDGDRLLATGTAFELKDSSQINSTSYIENCETSSVGRALAFLGIGIDVSIASSDEIAAAVEQQVSQETITELKAKALEELLRQKGVPIDKVLTRFNVSELTDLTEQQHLRAVHVWGLEKTK